jgi:enoyl-CoA hydratase
VNAVNVEFAEALHAAVDALVDASACRAVVLTGDRRSFCAGIDNREVPGYDPATRARMLRTINRTIRSLYGLAKPVVVAVSGHAIGAGLVVAIASDFRVVARGAFKLGLTEAAAGIPFPAAPLAICRAELSPRALRVSSRFQRTLRKLSWAHRPVGDRRPSRRRDREASDARTGLRAREAAVRANDRPASRIVGRT